jgi:hypothetical protein
MIAGGGIVEDDLPAVVIHVDAHFPWTEEHFLPGASLSEGLTRGARDAVPRSQTRVPVADSPAWGRAPRQRPPRRPRPGVLGAPPPRPGALRKGRVNPTRCGDCRSGLGQWVRWNHSEGHAWLSVTIFRFFFFFYWSLNSGTHTC